MKAHRFTSQTIRLPQQRATNVALDAARDDARTSTRLEGGARWRDPQFDPEDNDGAPSTGILRGPGGRAIPIDKLFDSLE